MKYTFTAGQTLSIAGAGDFFRLLSTSNPVTVEFYFQGREIAERVDVEAGFAEQFRTVDFDRVDITSSAIQTVQFETAKGSEIRYDRGAASISGIVDLTAATLNSLNRPEIATGFYSGQAATVANTPEQIFSAAANTNGAVIFTAASYVCEPNGNHATFLAKATAPTTLFDGETILQSSPVMAFNNVLNTNAIYYVSNGQLLEKQIIAAGKGLYYMTDTACSPKRSCRYKLL